ncbi:hypothetical protein BKA61DRAFT_628670 [Leptodontidium sp. MPI-SDFR-AT-0119]|nr:hypothetical protein BKA61DRAFT_628670 [Leptodontidium sp. MPI-SDFR-AT-0119]
MSRATISIQHTLAIIRDIIGQTFFVAPQGKESQDRLIYSQFYALIKTPFDTSKVYVFDNKSLENLALNPRYIRSLHKKRAYANLINAAPSLLPYYIINKYCFLFKHVLVHTTMTYSLLETIVIESLWNEKPVATWRFALPYRENILVRNVLMHEEYRRQWRVVKDL